MFRNRIPVTIWSEKGKRKTCLILITMLQENLIHFTAFGIRYRVGARRD